MTDPLDDTSRWTVLASRMETPQFIRDALDELMQDFINSLPEDSPALALWHRLPKPPRPGAEAPSTPYTVASVLTLRSKTGIGQRIGPCNPERESPEVVGGQSGFHRQEGHHP